jgi:hypothetical protein
MEQAAGAEVRSGRAPQGLAPRAERADYRPLRQFPAHPRTQSGVAGHTATQVRASLLSLVAQEEAVAPTAQALVAVLLAVVLL